jgi:hypothetical protein
MHALRWCLLRKKVVSPWQQTFVEALWMEQRQPIRQQLRQRRTVGDGTGSRVELVSGFGPLMMIMMSVRPNVTA